MTHYKCDALRNLVPFVQFKKREKQPWMSKPATLLKLTLLCGCFSGFLNCTNGTKLQKTSQMIILVIKVSSTFTLELSNEFS